MYISNGENLDGCAGFVDFFIKRLFRICPLFAMSILTYMVFSYLLSLVCVGGDELWIAGMLNPYEIKDVISYLSLTHNITGPNGLFQGPYWSLPIEF